MRGDFLQRSDRAIIALDGNDSRGAERQKRARQSARARTDFEDRDGLKRRRRAGDPGCEIKIKKEILAKRFSRG
jgi:hypothetical protein